MSNLNAIKGTITPLDDDILVSDIEQGERISDGGVIILNDTIASTQDADASGIRDRWVTVYKTGKNIDYVKPNDRILVEHGRWTFGINFIDEDDNKIFLQKIDVDAIILVEDS